jgi:hypothetical protein
MHDRVGFRILNISSNCRTQQQSSLSINENPGKEFSIYPDPGNGNFVISLDIMPGHTLTVLIYTTRHAYACPVYPHQQRC